MNMFLKKLETVFFLKVCYDFYNSDVAYGDMPNCDVLRAWYEDSFTARKGKNAEINILRGNPNATFKYNF